MPLTSPANAFTWGLFKQTNEGTVGTVATYDMPVYSGRTKPIQTLDRIAVTDASSIVGDPYKHNDEHWETDVVTPAFDDALGLMLVGLWPTDTKTSTGPWIHTFSGLGTTAAFFANMQLWGAGAFSEIHGKGQCSGISFSADQNGGPMTVNYRCVGEAPTAGTAYTTTTPKTMAGAHFTFTGGVLKFDETTSTPVTHTNVQAFTLDVPRPITPVGTADQVNVANLAQGRIEPSISLTLLWQDWLMYRSTYYGATAGTAASATLPAGSVELNAVDRLGGTSTLKLTASKVFLAADPPMPDPGAAPLTITVTGYVMGPAANIVPVLTNSVNAVY